MILLHHFFRMQVGHEQKGMTPKSRCCSGPEVTFLYKIHVCTYFLHFSIPRGRSHFQSHHLAHSKLISFLPNSSSFLLPSGPTPTIITFRNRHLHHPLSYFLLSFSPSVWPPLRFMNVLLCLLSYSHFFFVVPEPVPHLFDYRLSWITFSIVSSVTGSAQCIKN